MSRGYRCTPRAGGVAFGRLRQQHQQQQLLQHGKPSCSLIHLSVVINGQNIKEIDLACGTGLRRFPATTTTAAATCHTLQLEMSICSPNNCCFHYCASCSCCAPQPVKCLVVAGGHHVLTTPDDDSSSSAARKLTHPVQRAKSMPTQSPLSTRARTVSGA